MDVREKLVELFKHDNCPLFMVFGDKVDVLADYLIAHGVTVQDNTEITDELLKQLRNAPLTVLHEEPTIEVVQQWISVKDRLPEHKGNYLGFTGSTTMVGYYKGNGVWWVWLKDVEGENLFTHWMPLPQPPKGE